uniref:PAS domain S-box protein n=1 Tax=Halobaculum sp. EA56 TaxID=3421648 RepID=UPI003EBA954A
GDVDCVVSDYEMPGRNGIDFLERVREEYPELPFILYTGKGSEEVASDAISAGVTDYLQKGSGTDQYTVLANRIKNAVGRYRAERARQRHLDAIETARDGISILNEHGEFIYVNKKYADLYGYKSGEMVGEHWSLIYPDDEIQRAREDILPQVEEMGYWNGTTTGLRADGSTFLEDHRVTRTEYGELVCTVRDLSNETAVKKHLNRYRTLIEALDDAVYALDERGRFEYVNDAFVELVEYDRERILGSDVALIKTEDALAKAEDALGEVLSSDGPESYRFEVEILSKDGTRIPCEDHIGVLPFEGPSFDGSVGILRDITERNERERELKRKNDQLETLASVVSHDLRNPLNIAEGHLELAREDCTSAHLGTVKRAHDRMEALIEDILTLSRQNNAATDREPVALTAVVESCWTTVETDHASLVTDITRRVKAERGRLKQLFENLIRNAVEHGGGDVTITVGDLDDGFYIEDDGPGIPEEERDVIFHDGYSTNTEGTGLGLSIVREIVYAHDWEIHVTDGSDGGARFEITGVDFVAD